MRLSLEQRFEHYCDGVVSTLLHADREQPARWYIKGLMLPGERKSSVEPMAARVQPQQVRSAHQPMHHRIIWWRMRRGATKQCCRQWTHG